MPAEPDRVLVRTGPEPLDVAEAVAFVTRPEAGGVVVFLGTVRSPDEGRAVQRLEYELWEERVRDALRAIAGQALERHGATAAYVSHRSGPVGVGEPSVVVAASAPHRAEAFEACRFLIDALKAEAPIWKKEVTAAGERWVGQP